MSTLRRCLLPAIGLLALLSPSAGASEPAHVCYSVPTEIELKAPVGVGITTNATATATAGCAPATQGGVRGFQMTVAWTGTVSGKAPVHYNTNCGLSGTGPLTNQCSGTTSWFCAAPGTAPCSASASAWVFIENGALPLDRAEADDAMSVRCQYLA